MNTVDKSGSQPTYRRISGMAESMTAIDEVIAQAQHSLCIFDDTLERRGFGDPARIEMLRRLLLAGRAHRLRIALHEPAGLERHAPRLVNLLHQFPVTIVIHRTLGQARHAADPFVLADDHSVWHQMHRDHPRAIVALHSPADAHPLLERFEQIWEQSEPAIGASTLGL